VSTSCAGRADTERLGLSSPTKQEARTGGTPLFVTSTAASKSGTVLPNVIAQQVVPQRRDPPGCPALTLPSNPDRREELALGSYR
jgi:hypothetical protein